MYNKARTPPSTRWTSVWQAIQRNVQAKRGAWGLFSIVLVSLAFRLHLSSHCSLWLDEALTHHAVLKPWSTVLKGPTPGHPPLMYVLVKAATGLLGDSDTALRSVSLFFGCLWLAAIYELARELGYSARRALLVVATFALTPFFVRHATEARHYAILTTLCTLATTRALRLLKGPPHTRDLLGLAVCAVAAAATQYFGLAYALALLGAVAVGVVWGWKRAPLGRNLATLGVLLACLIPLALLGRRVASLGDTFEVGAPATSLAFNWSLLHEIEREFSFLMNDYCWLIEPGLALLGLVLLTLTLRGPARLLPLGLGVAPCVAGLLLSTSHFMSARYLALSGVFYHLGAWHAVFAVGARARAALAQHGRATLHYSVASALLIAALLGARLHEFPAGFLAGTDDYRGLQQYFKANLARDTALVAYPGAFGKAIFGKRYNVGTRPLGLEKFRPRHGVQRYLITTIHAASSGRQAELEALIAQHFHLTAEEWRALPALPLPTSRYQAAVFARLVQLPSDWKPPPGQHRRRPRPRKR